MLKSTTARTTAFSNTSLSDACSQGAVTHLHAWRGATALARSKRPAVRHCLINLLARQTGFRCWGCGGDARGGGLGLAIRLHFHNDAPQQLAIGLAFHQQAADELGGDNLSGAGGEGLGEVFGGRGGYGCGCV